MTASDTHTAPNAPLADPFGVERAASGIAVRKVHGETLPMLLRWKEVRAAARDVETFDSGQPGRVPTPPETDIRPFRQIPIETNPPEHTRWKDLLNPIFRRPTEAGPKAEMEAIVRDRLAAVVGAEPFDVVLDYALPVQSYCLSVLLDTDRSLADEWIGWGLHALRTDGNLDPAKSARFLEFIDRTLAKGAENPALGLFSYVQAANYEGRPLTHDEKRGICHLALAGGRDTVIHSIVGTFAILADEPGWLDTLREDPKNLILATEEIFRVLSPLPLIARVCPHGYDQGDVHVASDDRVALCWAAANQDADVFDAPEQIRLDRAPNPHVAFGAGAHSCLGAPMARLIIRTLLGALSEGQKAITVLEAQPRESMFKSPHLYDVLRVQLTDEADPSGETK